MLYSTDIDVIKQSLHDIHQYSEIQCKFTRRTKVRQLTNVDTLPANGHHAAQKQQPPLPNAANKQPTAVKVEEEKKKSSSPKGKETSTAAFFGNKTTG